MKKRKRLINRRFSFFLENHEYSDLYKGIENVCWGKYYIKRHQYDVGAS